VSLKYSEGKAVALNEIFYSVYWFFIWRAVKNVKIWFEVHVNYGLYWAHMDTKLNMPNGI